eukprot:CAMPEP_0185726230 /NCGR_PEP_ID=MMETSP1171-20130828/2276_1 /TAXON_ID=374046 /ORGANISM="Helicotheca tamensis, Strain CCMP826" /LENGTH=66 /DNA_ID=CAMNT_0028394545 /DNA_START=275 /DNA_END=475 /DNA_ORIENTATION=-
MFPRISLMGIPGPINQVLFTSDSEAASNCGMPIIISMDAPNNIAVGAVQAHLSSSMWQESTSTAGG